MIKKKKAIQNASQKLPWSVRAIADKTDLLNQLLLEGISPFNAAIRAGLTPFDACKYEDMINKHIHFERFAKMNNRDIAERRGITLGLMLDKLKEAAGIGVDKDGKPYHGATRSVFNSDNSDFNEVPDWYVRIKAIRELAVIGGFVDKNNDTSEKEQNLTNIVIVRAEKSNTKSVINAQQLQ